MKKFYIVLLGLFIALLQPVHALDISLSNEKISVMAGETKSVDINLNHIVNNRITMSISGYEPWMTFSEPQFIATNNQKTIRLYLSPYENIPTEIKRITIIAKSGSVIEEAKKDLVISILDKNYETEITDITIGGRLEPAGNAIIRFFIANNKDTTAYNIAVDAHISKGNKNLYEIKDSINKLNPDDIGLIKKEIILDEKLEAGEYTLTAKLYKHGKFIKEYKKTFNIIKKPVIVQTIKNVNAIFGFGKTIKVKNIGNAEGAAEYKDYLSGISKKFINIEGNATIKGNTITWNVAALQPGEESEISYVVDYSPLLFIVVISIVLTWFFMFKLRTVRIKKYVIQKRNIKKGSEFTIGIDIKNSTGKKVSRIEVIDFIPDIFKIEKTAGIDFRKRKIKGGIEIIWKINNLNISEERVLTYKIIPLFGIHGQIRLPRAELKFKIGDKIIRNKTPYSILGLVSNEKFV